jgi:hypothetical protein
MEDITDVAQVSSKHAKTWKQEPMPQGEFTVAVRLQQQA